MKILYRHLIGVGVGLGAGLLVSVTPEAKTVLDTAMTVCMRLAGYFLFPLMFFSLPIAVTKLRRIGRLGRFLFVSSLGIVISTAILSLLGTLLAWILKTGRIPIFPGVAPEFHRPDFWNLFRATVNPNLFQTLVGQASFLLPPFVLAFLLGWHFHHDRKIAEPAFNFFDSLSRIFYRANRFLLLLMPILLGFMSVSAVFAYRSVIEPVRYLPLLGILTGAAVLLIFGVFPLLLRRMDKRTSPWKILGGSGGAMVGALISGAPLFNYGNLIFHLHENLEIKRKVASLAAPYFVMFSRGGTAMIAAVSMIILIRSNSSLEITLFQIVWTVIFAFLTSFALPSVPNRGLATCLALMGGLYGRGLEDAWFILAPVLPFLAMLAALIDTVIAVFLMVFITKKCGLDGNPGFRV